MSGWVEASWWNVALLIVPTLAACVAIRVLTHKPPVPGEGGEPPRPAAPHPPDGQRPPLAPGLTWTRITTTLEAECGCVHTLDPVARTRIKDECERHRFATEWNERLRQS